LPERLQCPASRYYAIGSSAAGSSGDTAQTNGALAAVCNKLHGKYCTGSEDAVAASRAGADFLVMRGALPDGELAALCESVPMPVFVRGLELEQAWALGASGINEIDKALCGQPTGHPK